MPSGGGLHGMADDHSAAVTLTVGDRDPELAEVLDQGLERPGRGPVYAG
jgi:hypothetical protein